MASTQKPASEPRAKAPKPSEVAKDLMPDAPADFEPVEFWNPVYPNEHIYVHLQGHPAEYAQNIHFLAGYYRATKPWEVDAILEACPGRVYTADTDSQIRCDKCGWATRSTAAMMYHIQQHA